MMSPNRRIALNVIATYGRSLYALVLGLFSARWALQALGQVDYGLYGVVGGLTAFVSFVNSILGFSVERFYAVSIGEEKIDIDQGVETCRKWFTTAVIIHTFIPIVLITVGYPIGIWAVQSFLTIPADRLEECVWVWRFVCISCFVGMIVVPFCAMYTAKQYIAELTIYSFVTTTLTAICLFYMVNHPGVWLAKYAFWQVLMALLPNMLISVRAYFLFQECRIKFKYIRCFGNIRQVIVYGFWTAWGGLGALFRAQGNAILVNKYFGPRVNSAITVATGLSSHCNTLAGSMIGAFSPAIFNCWGAKDYDKARGLAYKTCKIGTLLTLVFAIPLALEVDEVLSIWLVCPPRYAGGLCVCVLIMTVVDKLAVGHMLCVNANGIIAKYQGFLGTSLILTLPIAWILVEFNFGVYSVGFAMIATMTCCALGRVWFARSLVGMSARYWLGRILLPIALVSVVAGLVGLVPRLWMQASFGRVCLTTLMVELALLPLSWFLILDRDERTFVEQRIRRFTKR